MHSPSALTEHVSPNLAGIFLLDPVLPMSAKLVKPSHTSWHTYQFLIILSWGRDPFQCGRPTSTSPQSSSLEAIITRDTQVRAKMRGRRRKEEGRKGIDVRLSQMDTSASSKEGRQGGQGGGDLLKGKPVSEMKRGSGGSGHVLSN